MQNDAKPSIVGESWGAMLALAYASAYPETTAAIVLVGCGTFDKGVIVNSCGRKSERVQLMLAF
jgi:pimeloyl-ACP methyl ester carboxylesterase